MGLFGALKAKERAPGRLMDCAGSCPSRILGRVVQEGIFVLDKTTFDRSLPLGQWAVRGEKRSLP